MDYGIRHPMHGKSAAEQLAFALGLKCGYEGTWQVQLGRETGRSEPVYCVAREDLCDDALKDALSKGVVAGSELAKLEINADQKAAGKENKRG